MSRRRKSAYLMLLALGAVALVVDQWLLPRSVMEPDLALAVGGLGAEPGPGSASPQASGARTIPELPFPRGLKKYDPHLPMRDLFAPPSLATGPAPPTPDKAKASSGVDERPGNTSSAAFVTHHTLDGVLIQEGLKIAIVDGVWVHIGESVAGCALRNISGNEAYFDCFDGEATLKVGDARIWSRD
jgi:hypothetical protein